MYFWTLLATFAKEHPWLFASNIAFMLFMPLNDVLLPHLFGRLVENIKSNTNFTGIFIAIIATLAAVQVGTLLSDWHDTFMTPVFQGHVRNAVMSTVFKRHETAYHELSIGQLLNIIIKSPNSVLTLFNRIKDYLLPYVLLFVSAAAYFWWYDWVLGLALVAAVTLIFAVLVVSPSACSSASTEKAALYSGLQDEVDDIMRNLLSVYTSDHVDVELERLKAIDVDHVASCKRTMRCALYFKLIGFPLILAIFAFFVLRCHALTRAGRLGVGAFVSLLLIVITMMHNLMWVVDIIRDIVFDSGFMITAEKQILGTDGAAPKVDVRHGAGDATPHPTGVGLHHVSFTYPGSAAPVLSDVSVHFAPGERVVVAGPIGTGKSTLTKLVDMLYRPTEGDLYIGGRWYSDLTSSEVRARVGYVPQQPVLFNRSVYENIAYGNAKTSEEEIDRVVAKLGIAGEFSGLSEGMRTRIGKNGSKLSGGQRQLVWCLRTLIMSPEVIVLDEPTASMDEATKRTLEKVLDALTEDKTVIIVSHDEYMISRASRIVQLA